MKTPNEPKTPMGLYDFLEEKVGFEPTAEGDSMLALTSPGGSSIRVDFELDLDKGAITLVLGEDDKEGVHLKELITEVLDALQKASKKGKVSKFEVAEFETEINKQKEKPTEQNVRMKSTLETVLKGGEQDGESLVTLLGGKQEDGVTLSTDTGSSIRVDSNNKITLVLGKDDKEGVDLKELISTKVFEAVWDALRTMGAKNVSTFDVSAQKSFERKLNMQADELISGQKQKEKSTVKVEPPSGTVYFSVAELEKQGKVEKEMRAKWKQEKESKKEAPVPFQKSNPRTETEEKDLSTEKKKPGPE